MIFFRDEFATENAAMTYVTHPFGEFFLTYLGEWRFLYTNETDPIFWDVSEVTPDGMIVEESDEIFLELIWGKSLYDPSAPAPWIIEEL